MVIQILAWDRDRDRAQKGGFKIKFVFKANAAFEVIGIDSGTVQRRRFSAWTFQRGPFSARTFQRGLDVLDQVKELLSGIYLTIVEYAKTDGNPINNRN